MLGILFSRGVLSEWSFIAIVVVTFFLASAGASAAYLTVSEIFPMETRALAIAFFYAKPSTRAKRGDSHAAHSLRPNPTATTRRATPTISRARISPAS